MSAERTDTLDQALEKAALDPSAQLEFLHILSESDVYVIGQVVGSDGAAGTGTIEAGQQIEVSNVDIEGVPHVPFFTTLDKLSKFAPGASYLRLNTCDLFNVAAGASFVLNLGSNFGKAFTPDEAAGIANGTRLQTSSRTVEQPEEVMIGEPADRPEALLELLHRIFEARPAVLRAWLAHYFNAQDGEPPHTLIAIEVEPRQRDLGPSIVNEAAAAASRVTIPHPPIDFFLLEPGDDVGLAGYFLKAAPFFER